MTLHVGGWNDDKLMKKLTIFGIGMVCATMAFYVFAACFTVWVIWKLLLHFEVI